MSTKTVVLPVSRAGYSFGGGSTGWRPRVACLAARWEVLAARARSRRALASLDRRLLEDVGLTPGQAAAEAARPRWEG